MGKSLGLLLCSITILVLGMVIFITDRVIDVSVLIKLIKIGIPACFVMYYLGILISKILAKSCADTDILSNLEQQQFIEDLLLKPSQVSHSHSFIEHSDEIAFNEFQASQASNNDSDSLPDNSNNKDK